MENLFLEILRILDLKYNNTKEDIIKNTDFYFFPLEYNKLLYTNKVINLDNLNMIMEENYSYYKSSLFTASKLDAESIYVKSINFEDPETYFYKNRDILLYICIFLKFSYNLLKFDKDFDNNIERNFINNNISESDIDLFIETLNIFYTNKNNLDLYTRLTNVFKKKSFESKKDLLSYSITDSLRLAINLYFYSNSFDKGLKESLIYNFETVIFYIMLNLLSTNINSLKLSTIYLSIENSNKN